MANAKFSKILALIREIFGLISDLIPVVDDALDAVATIRQLVVEFSEKRKEVADE